MCGVAESDWASRQSLLLRCRRCWCIAPFLALLARWADSQSALLLPAQIEEVDSTHCVAGHEDVCRRPGRQHLRGSEGGVRHDRRLRTEYRKIDLLSRTAIYPLVI